MDLAGFNAGIYRNTRAVCEAFAATLGIGKQAKGRQLDAEWIVVRKIGLDLSILYRLASFKERCP